MCGRFTQMFTWQEVHDFLNLSGAAWEVRSNYNVAPTQEVAVVREVDSERRLEQLHWGLIPFWAEDPSIGNRLINARAETAHAKPSFREAFKRRRCVIPASGFYEWRTVGSQKQPYAIGQDTGRPLLLAGLWESWTVKGVPMPPAYRKYQVGDRLDTCVILTTEANEALRILQHRMPVILEPEEAIGWIQRRDVPLEPFPSKSLVTWPVSTRVNNPTNNGPENWKPARGKSRFER